MHALQDLNAAVLTVNQALLRVIIEFDRDACSFVYEGNVTLLARTGRVLNGFLELLLEIAPHVLPTSHFDLVNDGVNFLAGLQFDFKKDFFLGISQHLKSITKMNLLHELLHMKTYLAFMPISEFVIEALLSKL